MTLDASPPEAVVKPREGLSAIWLIPFIAIAFGAWLIVKAISERGVFIDIRFDNASGIVVGKTEVRYKGLPVGVVSGVDVTQDLKGVQVEVEMVASTEALLTDKTQFWYVTADVSFQGVTGLDTLLSGSYINMQPDIDSEGESKRSFVALGEEPIVDQDIPGLHIRLQTDTLGSIRKSSPVSYKQMIVGHVSGYRYDDNSGLVDILVFIEPQHAHLVKENSRFWDASGFEFTGSLTSGVKLKTESLASIFAGGIAFGDSIFEAVLPPAENGQQFTLFADYQSAEMGHEITLILNWDAGIDRGAAIEYQGITLGVIEDYEKIDPQARQITAKAKVNPRVVPYLTTKSQFYVSAPTIDLSGVTNLHNVLKGAHISLRPSLDGEPQDEFNVYSYKPAYSYDEPGLHLVLEASDVESLRIGTKIFYKKQAVGSVQSIENVAMDKFLIHIYIEPDYQNYVNENTRFWNTSGFSVSGGLQNFEVHAHSMQSILAGGIGFSHFNEAGKDSANGDKFRLFTSKSMAQEQVNVSLLSTTATDLVVGTRVMYRGELVGSIHDLHRDQETVKISLGILPEFRFLLKEKSQFWVVRPDVSLTGLSDTDALFGGAYININSGIGEAQSHFMLSQSPPAKHSSSTGLQLSLTAFSGNVVNPGSPISYRGILVGQVDNVALDSKEDKVLINITIDEEYRHLITNFTRFYNASGITISGGIGNFIVKSESTDAILRGGISFYNPENTNEDKVEELAEFPLYQNVEYARLAGIGIKIHFNNAESLTTNLKLKYQDHEVGVVSRVVFNADNFGATVYAFLNDNGRKFAVKGSKFWMAKTELGLVGSTNVGSLLEGGFIGVLPGDGELVKEFNAEDIPPVTKRKPIGLNIALNSDKLGSVRVGNPVLYRQVKVGEVIGVDLSPTADQVQIYINIAQRYAPLVKHNSKFWNASGLSVNGGLFSGVNIDTESIETILSGGVAFATPDSSQGEGQSSAQQRDSFTLHENADEEWLEWQPKIYLNTDN